MAKAFPLPSASRCPLVQALSSLLPRSFLFPSFLSSVLASLLLSTELKPQHSSYLVSLVFHSGRHCTLVACPAGENANV